MGVIVSRLLGCRTFNTSTDLLDLTGKVILVTGANTGIGYMTARNLARRGAKVYLGARNESKATGAIAQMEAEGLGTGQVIWHKVDLSDPRNAKQAAEEFMRREARLDVLINNAGIAMHMVVNHVSPFVFTQTLLKLMKKTTAEPDSDVRIVMLSSFLHRNDQAANPNIQFKTIDDFNHEFADQYSAHRSRYSITKLANVLYAKALQRKLDAEEVPITCISIHPGIVDTFSDRLAYASFVRTMLYFFGSSTDEGSYTSCFAAASPLIKENPQKYKGVFLDPSPVGKIVDASPNACRVDLQEQLWETTERAMKEAGVL
ncbi:NAD(P)-binding protein [Fistulina hepatica ATCC 64428]|uniref:NAD(P)-binding protein n=1 Tax=Fistulina hepatica ATCC 64428 TaxID=1128425 RepID=A0A0D7ABU4_9AGAR|nr:NAD(P)-binding protein [Fistulina hepatica ATCC 64428]